jgi:hypothetical protein
MTESLNLAPALAAALGHDLPPHLCELALISAAGVAVALGWAWVRRN